MCFIMEITFATLSCLQLDLQIWFKKLFQQTPTQGRQKFKVTPCYLICVAKKGWEEVKKTVKKVTNIRNISNEKVKQKNTIQPKGQSFEAIHELKDYVSENNKYLIYEVNLYLKHQDRKFYWRRTWGETEIALWKLNTPTSVEILKRLSSSPRLQQESIIHCFANR